MTPQINSLIDPIDQRLIVLNSIAELLKVEFDNQLILAQNAGADTTPYDVRVFESRYAPIGQLIDLTDQNKDLRTVINIQSINGNRNAGTASALVGASFKCLYYIDIFGFAINKIQGSGQDLPDRRAFLNADQTFSVVRKIISSVYYQTLACDPKLVSKRNHILNYAVLGTNQDENPTVAIHAIRLNLEVVVGENQILNDGVPLQGMDYTIIRSETGEVLIDGTEDL